MPDEHAHHWLEFEDHEGRKYRDMQLLEHRPRAGKKAGQLCRLRTLFTQFVCVKCGDTTMMPVDVRQSPWWGLY